MFVTSALEILEQVSVCRCPFVIYHLILLTNPKQQFDILNNVYYFQGIRLGYGNSALEWGSIDLYSKDNAYISTMRVKLLFVWSLPPSNHRNAVHR